MTGADIGRWTQIITDIFPEQRRQAICHVGSSFPCWLFAKIWGFRKCYGRKYGIPISRSKRTTTNFCLWTDCVAPPWCGKSGKPSMVCYTLDVFAGKGFSYWRQRYQQNWNRSGIDSAWTSFWLPLMRWKSKIADRTLVGTCSELIHYLIELRGIRHHQRKELSWIVGAVKPEKTVALVIRLEMWDNFYTGLINYPWSG